MIKYIPTVAVASSTACGVFDTLIPGTQLNQQTHTLSSIKFGGLTSLRTSFYINLIIPRSIMRQPFQPLRQPLHQLLVINSNTLRTTIVSINRYDIFVHSVGRLTVPDEVWTGGSRREMEEVVRFGKSGQFDGAPDQTS